MLSRPFGTDNFDRLQVIRVIACSFFIQTDNGKSGGIFPPSQVQFTEKKDKKDITAAEI